MKKTTLLLTCALLAAPTLSFADDRDDRRGIDYNGPVEITPVKALLDDDSFFSDRDVVVEGHLVKRLREDLFLFSDGKHEIRVELDDDMHLPGPIDAKTKVRLFGEYENHRQPEIEVDYLQVM
ncbi:YgiW/YdeI family stress tolerance OB fold protein [Vibrio porteresiae]|uniref:NirD/YgiW/YdeI family stress tolerance protein n=1 Tax=Vibrio porteresiae DSM 19223 TaxID=1123496 RepID=A0ABZ0QGS5_9VIBR|nr:NirD/YgiW/YdeI family stress tolerance protein [Vibrio porteresiae]WPC75634.1 NirD/YgiW/YdeI family stress tolerance protein [Vibrio porteresiae DSM 19223]